MERKRKLKKAKPLVKSTKPSFKLCRVCGDKASSFNYDGLSCDSCKSFFYRIAPRKQELECDKNNTCEITIVSRKACKKCRLDRCFAIGMKKELIMKRKPYQLTSEVDQEVDRIKCEILSYLKTSPLTNSKSDLQYPTLTNLERAKIEAVSGYFKYFREESSIKTVLDPPIRDEWVKICENYAMQIVRSLKNIPEMRNFTMKDKMAMTKNFIHVFTTLRFKFSYDIEKQHGLMVEIKEQKVCYRASMNIIWKDIIPEEFSRKWTEAIVLNKSVMLNDPIVRDLAITTSLFREGALQVSCPEVVRLHYLEYYYLLRRYLQVKLKTRDRFERHMTQFHEVLNAFPKMQQFARQFYELISPHYNIELMNDIYNLSLDSN